MSLRDLESAVDAALTSGLPPGLADAIDRALAAGATRREVLRAAEAAYGAGDGLVISAVEAYLRAKDGRAGP